MYFDLWNLLVENIFGGFWLTILGLALFLGIILGFFGRLSSLSTMFYVMLFLSAMVIGFGYKWLVILIFFAMLIWVYIQFKNATNY